MSEPSDEWSVGVVAETITGNVVLRMTSDQAESLRETLTFLMEGE